MTVYFQSKMDFELKDNGKKYNENIFDVSLKK